MKNAFFITGLIFASFAATAQTMTKDENGNFVQVKAETAVHDSTTTHTAKFNGKKDEPVYIGKRGGMYVIRYAKKSGKFYRKYLKRE